MPGVAVGVAADVPRAEPIMPQLIDAPAAFAGENVYDMAGSKTLPGAIHAGQGHTGGFGGVPGLRGLVAVVAIAAAAGVAFAQIAQQGRAAAAGMLAVGQQCGQPLLLNNFVFTSGIGLCQQ